MSIDIDRVHFNTGTVASGLGLETAPSIAMPEELLKYSFNIETKVDYLDKEALGLFNAPINIILTYREGATPPQWIEKGYELMFNDEHMVCESVYKEGDNWKVLFVEKS